jgi:hypothetical protein
MSTDRITFFYPGTVLLEENLAGGSVAHPAPPVNTPMVKIIMVHYSVFANALLEINAIHRIVKTILLYHGVYLIPVIDIITGQVYMVDWLEQVFAQPL